MSNYRSMIDDALQSARARIDGGSADLMKTASAPENSMVKEASELADALEYVAHASTNTGSAADAVRGEMVRSFFKSAAGSPAQSSTSVQGTQAHAPAGKKIPAKGQAVGGSAPQSETTPAPADGKKPLLESFKQAEGQSLYDILMASKTAGRGGPSESTASEYAQGIPSGNENANRQALLSSNEAPVRATRRQAKAPVRKRLSEAFAHTNSTTGDATLNAMFPQAASNGGHKVASVKERLQKTAGQEGAAVGSALLGPIGAAMGAEKGKGWQAAGGSLAGGLGGGLLGAGLGAVGGSKGALIGGALGSLGGRAYGAHRAHGANMSAKERLLKAQQAVDTQKARDAGQL